MEEQGIWYRAAFHPHAHTETAVGHTTIATGAYPSRHGIIANAWTSPEGKKVDAVYGDTLVTGTQEAGSSPSLIQASTFSDELRIATGGKSRSFAVSLKDRAAIPLAGRTGKAFWFSSTAGATTGGQFVSSTYYYGDTLPAWANDWNALKRADSFANQSWNLSHDRASYWFANTPAFANPKDPAHYGVTFPHPFGPVGEKNPLFYTKVTASPVGDELTLEFALALIEHEQLGQKGVPDFLGLSFSCNDFIGHIFSNTSMEIEDNFLRLDRTLARLFQAIDRNPKLGLKNTLFVLAGDHGAPEIPEYLAGLKFTLPAGVNEPGRIEFAALTTAAKEALMKKYGRDDLLFGFKVPSFYLDRALIASAGLDQAEVERVVVQAALSVPGVAAAVRTSETEAETGLDPELMAQIRRNYFAGRSGDVFVVQQPYWQISEDTRGEAMSVLNHGSPWAYDTYVPVVFAGAGLSHATVDRRISTTDVAATLALEFETKFPSGCIGSPLREVLEHNAPRKEGY